MSDGRLLQDLAQMAKEDRRAELDQLDERWDRLSQGTLSADEEAELRALAEGSDELRDAYDAFRPLDADFRERVLNAVLEPEADESPEPPAKILPFRRRTTTIAGFLAAAAALSLVVVRLGGPGGAPLPQYHLALEGGVSEIRSEESEVSDRDFAAGSRLDLKLRPQVDVSGPVEARFFVARDDELRVWDVSAKISSNGVVHVAGVLGRDFELEPGEWTLWAAVGRSGALPDRERLQALLAASDLPIADDWSLHKTQIRVVAEPPT